MTCEKVLKEKRKTRLKNKKREEKQFLLVFSFILIINFLLFVSPFTTSFCCRPSLAYISRLVPVFFLFFASPETTVCLLHRRATKTLRLLLYIYFFLRDVIVTQVHKATTDMITFSLFCVCVCVLFISLAAATYEQGVKKKERKKQKTKQGSLTERSFGVVRVNRRRCGTPTRIRAYLQYVITRLFFFCFTFCVYSCSTYTILTFFFFLLVGGRKD